MGVVLARGSSTHCQRSTRVRSRASATPLAFRPSTSSSTTSCTSFRARAPAALLAWITGVDRSGHFLTFMTRDAFQQDSTFEAAVQRANTTKLLGPAYVIIGGVG